MTDLDTLAALGWAPDFLRQLTLEELSVLTPCRVAAVHRDRVSALCPGGPVSLHPPADLTTGDIAVGDWALCLGNQLVRLLTRRTLLARRAAGTGVQRQLIAANVDSLFIVSSCNADFNPARLERYLALARAANVAPVIVLSRADLSAAPDHWQDRAAAVDRRVPVVMVDARAPGTALADWCGRGQTVALLGSSGVGKTTLANALTGGTAATGEIREDDAKGRHTTTERQLRAMAAGGWLIDTPGMRALRLSDAAEGIATTFDEIETLAQSCRFGDCSHDPEPGCAVQAAIAAGTLDPARLERWHKLQREDRHNSETLAEAHARDRAFGKMVRTVMRDKTKRRGG
ncbi:ribosome small subunit-dependent GTPase A [Rhodobacter sp. TJ_12]|uniref:ribosome small subunit-dependent GTPase A n=1 Tax=Rhodobacter sp. TJ_12 TaxID=2029399 RepID=UPI001CBB8FF3|nr:ribosome small subunit-dependent GTPase A [Rhodobacter sp. TJ_12]MBZ4021921.1 ribosome small subunit-dependent GTPase A [Rhodobacter sp. TJ_12]